jgi:hypothetical protein
MIENFSFQSLTDYMIFLQAVPGHATGQFFDLFQLQAAMA